MERLAHLFRKKHFFLAFFCALFSTDSTAEMASKAYVDRITESLAQVNADWNATSGAAQILNKPVLGSAAYVEADAFATASQGALADSAVQPNVLGNYATQAWVLAQGYAMGEGGLPATEENLNGLQTTLLSHIQDRNNPHETTKADVGLGNVQNLDQTNASNLVSGTVAYGRLPVGMAPMTVAAGNDSRFDAIAEKANSADLGTAAYTDSAQYATAAMGALATTAVQNVTVSGTGNVVASVTKNTETNNLTATLGTVPTTADVTALSNRIGNLENLGYFLGVAPTKAALPTTISAAQAMWGTSRLPAVGDYADILVDESHDDANDSYRIVGVGGSSITWSSGPFRVYSNDTSGYMIKVPAATAGNIGVFTPTGQMNDSGISIDTLPSAEQTADMNAHLADKENPHQTTKALIGLSNVKNLDQTNASNITSGTLSTERLSVGTTANTVAAGNDSRFNTIPTSIPTEGLTPGRAFIWLQ